MAPGELDLVDEAESIFAEMPDEPLAEKRFAALLGQLAPETLWLGMANSTLRLDLTERATGETWPVPAVVHRMGLAASFSAEIDPNSLAAGARLADGLWDLYLHFGVLGVAVRRRTTSDARATARPCSSGAGQEWATDDGRLLHTADLRPLS